MTWSIILFSKAAFLTTCFTFPCELSILKLNQVSLSPHPKVKLKLNTSEAFCLVKWICILFCLTLNYWLNLVIKQISPFPLCSCIVLTETSDSLQVIWKHNRRILILEFYIYFMSDLHLLWRKHFLLLLLMARNTNCTHFFCQKTEAVWIT